MKNQECAEVRSAWLAAKVTIVCAVLTIVVQVAGYFLAAHDKRKEELMEHRRQALIAALEVVDHVYANVSWSGKPPSNPHQWDNSSARTAMNGIIIYCKDPNRVLAAFSKATGMYNPDTQKPTLFGPKELAEFRDVICEELEAPHIKYADSNLVWIYSMPGAK
jgi:hypothetical protein